MKERIKQFYEEHKEACIIGAATLAVSLVVAKKIRDNKYTTADQWVRDDGDHIITVFKRNGKTTTFLRPAA